MADTEIEQVDQVYACACGRVYVWHRPSNHSARDYYDGLAGPKRNGLGHAGMCARKHGLAPDWAQAALKIGGLHAVDAIRDHIRAWAQGTEHDDAHGKQGDAAAPDGERS